MKNLYAGILRDAARLEGMSLSNRTELAKYRFDIQLENTVEERSRFFDMVERGEYNGVKAWEKQAIR